MQIAKLSYLIFHFDYCYIGTVVQNGGFPIKLKSDGKTPDIVSQPKEVRIFNGKPFLMETALQADFAIIKVQRVSEIKYCDVNLI